MWKNILISLILFIILVIEIKLIYDTRKENKTEENIVKNETNLSSEYVIDDCINEWKDYSLVVQEEIREASQNLNDENKTYLVRAEDSYLKVYYLNNKGEEVLYRVTDISMQYLEKEDVEKLTIGIKVKGLQELNQVLEDFE